MENKNAITFLRLASGMIIHGKRHEKMGSHWKSNVLSDRKRESDGCIQADDLHTRYFAPAAKKHMKWPRVVWHVATQESCKKAPEIGGRQTPR